MDTQISEENPLRTGQLLPRVWPRGALPMALGCCSRWHCVCAGEKLWLLCGVLVSAGCQASLEAFLLLVQASGLGITLISSSSLDGRWLGPRL